MISVGMGRVGADIDLVGLLDQAFRRTQVVHLRFFHVVDQGTVETHEQWALKLKTRIDERFLEKLKGVIENVVMDYEHKIVMPLFDLNPPEGCKRTSGLMNLAGRIGFEANLAGLRDTRARLMMTPMLASSQLVSSLASHRHPFNISVTCRYFGGSAGP